MLKIKLFDYYFSRLPALRFARFNRKYKLSIKEIESISKLSFVMMDTKYNKEMKECHFSGLHRQFMNFSKYPRALRLFYLRRIENLLYDYTWLIDFFKSYYSEYLSDTNINNFAIHILDSCFPMFWDTFRQKIIESLVYSFNLGYVNGTKDTEELTFKGH